MGDKKIFKKRERCTDTTAPLADSTEDVAIAEDLDDVTNSTNTGLFNTPSPSGAVASYNAAPNEKSLGQPESGAEIVFGQDRATTAASGLGGEGSFSPRIDLVVGRGASMNNGSGPNIGDVVENNFFADAARIYICSRTMVDRNFGLETFFQEIGQGSFKPRSAVAIKADHVRLIGREGVKIVTGRAQNTKAGAKGELNSQGGKLPNAPPIILCAGNVNSRKKVRGGWFTFAKPEYVMDVQPIPRGENLRDCLLELDETINHIISFTQMLANIVSITTTALGVNWAQPQYPGIASNSAMLNNNFSATPLGQARRNHQAWRTNYLERLWSYKYILSSNVLSN